MKETIKLFRAVPIDSKKKKNLTVQLLKETVKCGFIFAPEVVYNYSDNIEELIKEVSDLVGISGEAANKSFHKSWKKVKDASIEQLINEQIVHYLTTYGFEALGCYDKDSVYIPNEKLDVPEDVDIRLTVIKGYTKEELKEKLLKLLGTGIALAKDTIEDVVVVALFVEINEKEISAIKNKEVKTVLYDKLKMVPENATEFLRFCMFKAMGGILLIKSPSVLHLIKEQVNKDVVKLFKGYEKEYGLTKLAEIFYRFKPIFLAFRSEDKLKPVINQIRRLAKIHHKPMPEDYLNLVTAKIKAGEKIDAKTLEKELKRVNIFRKIRLAYALKFRTKDAGSILYRVRSGKGFAKEFAFVERAKASKVLGVVINSIVKDINVKGKKIFIPEDMNYAIPATEKQFTGMFPSGSYISIPKDMVVGISWKDVGDHRVDLDLSVISADEKIGWDSSYRTDDGDILFSGDITSAPNGATELFYIKKQVKKALILMVNYYNYTDYDESVAVPFKILAASEKVASLGENYMVDQNNIKAVAETEINEHEKMLGLIISTTTGSRFYFAETYLGGSITSSNSEFIENARKYLLSFYENTIELKDILEKAGAKFVKDVEKCDIDLSPEALEKDTILNLLTKK